MRTPRGDIKLPRRVIFALAVVIASEMTLAYALGRVFTHPAALVGFGTLLGAPLALFIMERLVGPIRMVLRALGDGMLSLAEKEYGIRVAQAVKDPDIVELVSRFNRLTEILRSQHADVYQKELLLETVIEAAPMAIVLCNEADRIVLANGAARDFLHDGQPLLGAELAGVFAARGVPGDAGDGLVTVELARGSETLHVSRRFFEISTQRHTLVIMKSLTREVAQAESEVWKKAIRVISHELNNSLAPITSLIHSARLIQKNPEHAHRLGGIFDTIEERAGHLKGFLEGYARLAKLPRPSPRAVAWRELFAGLGRLYTFRVAGTVPDERGWFDPAQLEQVLINLLKNAVEAGGPKDEIVMEIGEARGGVELRVMDRGKGMTADELREARLPFYSTKKTGSGLGLALCRDIVDAHGGELALASRDGGGVAVTVWLPGAPAEAGVATV